MIAKVTFGADAGVLVRYVTGSDGEHDVGTIEYRNLIAAEARGASREMAVHRSRGAVKPYMHLILSWPRHERPTSELMVAAMTEALRRLGLGDHQAVIATHKEKEHLHVHAVVNRAGPDLRAWETWRSYERIMAVVREVERDLGFELYVGPERATRQQAERAKARESRIYERSGKEPGLKGDGPAKDDLASRLGPDVRKTIRNARSWAGLHAALNAQYSLAIDEYVDARNPRRRGLQIVDQRTGNRCPASAIGSDFGRAALERRLGSFEPHCADQEKDADRQRHERESLRPRPERATRGRRDGADDLYGEFRAERDAKAASRRAAMADHRSASRRERERIRDERRETIRRFRSAGVRGTALKALQSVVAFEAAKAREELAAQARAGRSAVYREHRTPTWSEFVRDRARAGDQRAIEYLWRRRVLSDRDADEKCFTGSEMPPQISVLADLRASVDERTGSVSYFRGADLAFIDRGSEIALSRWPNDNALAAALKVAASKWGAVTIVGDERFTTQSLEMAAQLGIRVTNPELRERYDQLIAQGTKSAKSVPLAVRVGMQITGKVLVVDGNEIEIDRGRGQVARMHLADVSLLRVGEVTRIHGTSSGWIRDRNFARDIDHDNER